jgi:hypothetical protein
MRDPAEGQGLLQNNLTTKFSMSPKHLNYKELHSTFRIPRSNCIHRSPDGNSVTAVLQVQRNQTSSIARCRRNPALIASCQQSVVL